MVLTAALVWCGYRLLHEQKGLIAPSSVPAATGAKVTGQVSSAGSNGEPTKVYAHDLLLKKGPDFRVYVRWLRGQMTPANKNENPSFDDPDSFYLDIKAGVLRANIGDIGHFLNSALPAGSPLRNITLSGDGDQFKITGTLHKFFVSIPIALSGTLSALSNNNIRLRITKINLLKIPFKGLLGTFHVQLSDLFKAKDLQGVSVNGNDVVFDTQTLLPPPHIRGKLTAVRVANPDLEEVYGDAAHEVERVEQWRNFLRLSGGTIDFGKLTMHHVDLIMIDISKDMWFNLDLANYQAQLVNGYTRMTPEAGLQIFMPDLRDLPKSKKTRSISIEWMKNRNLPPPPGVTSK